MYTKKNKFTFLTEFIFSIGRDLKALKKFSNVLITIAPIRYAETPIFHY
jgi:hypothetical protein